MIQLPICPSLLRIIGIKQLTNLEDIRSLDEAHERKETAVGPAVNGNTAQVHKVKLLCHVLQPLHLVFNLHLTLKRQI